MEIQRAKNSLQGNPWKWNAISPSVSFALSLTIAFRIANWATQTCRKVDLCTKTYTHTQTKMFAVAKGYSLVVRTQRKREKESTESVRRGLKANEYTVCECRKCTHTLRARSDSQIQFLQKNGDDDDGRTNRPASAESWADLQSCGLCDSQRLCESWAVWCPLHAFQLRKFERNSRTAFLVNPWIALTLLVVSSFWLYFLAGQACAAPPSSSFSMVRLQLQGLRLRRRLLEETALCLFLNAAARAKERARSLFSSSSTRLWQICTLSFALAAAATTTTTTAAPVAVAVAAARYSAVSLGGQNIHCELASQLDTSLNLTYVIILSFDVLHKSLLSLYFDGEANLLIGNSLFSYHYNCSSNNTEKKERKKEDLSRIFNRKQENFPSSFSCC